MFQEQDGWFSNFQETMSENAPDHLQILQNHQVSEFESIPVPSLPEFLKAALTVRIEFAPAVRIMQVAWKGLRTDFGTFKRDGQRRPTAAVGLDVVRPAVCSSARTWSLCGDVARWSNVKLLWFWRCLKVRNNVCIHVTMYYPCISYIYFRCPILLGMARWLLRSILWRKLWGVQVERDLASCGALRAFGLDMVSPSQAGR